MKLSQLKETTVNPLSWIKDHYGYKKFDEYDVSNSHDGVIFHDSLNLKNVAGEIPFKFKAINGTFAIHAASLTSLKNFPETVNGDCLVINQLLTSLEHCPKKIHGFFNVSGNELTKIDYFPEYVGGNIDLASNKIATLEGIHKKIPKMMDNQKLFFENNPIKKSILGLLLIEGLMSYDISWGTNNPELKEAIKIMKPYYGGGRAAVIECQEKMIDAGLDEFAEI